MKKGVRTYRGACEGLQKYLYLERLEELINESEEYSFRVAFLLHNSKGGSPEKVVKDSIKYAVNTDEDKRVAMYDYDFKTDSFIRSIKLSSKNNIFPAFSIMNFNLFLILHKKDYYKSITNEDNYEKDLRKAYNIDRNSDIKSEKCLLSILEQIDLDDVKKAIERAKIVNAKSQKVQEKILDNIYDQPFLNVHIFLERVFKEISQKEEVTE